MSNEIIKREVTLGQLITVAITLITLIIAQWVSLNIRVTKLEVESTERTRYETEYRLEMKSSQAETNATLKTLNESVQEIKVSLQNKQDRR